MKFMKLDWNSSYFSMKYTNDKEQFVVNILPSMDSLIENLFYKYLIYELKYLVESLNIATPDYPLLTGDEIFSIDNYLQTPVFLKGKKIPKGKIFYCDCI